MPEKITEPKIVLRVNRNPSNADRPFGVNVLGFSGGWIQFDQRSQSDLAKPNHPLVVDGHVIRPALGRVRFPRNFSPILHRTFRIGRRDRIRMGRELLFFHIKAPQIS